MTPTVEFQRHQQVRDRIRATLDQLRAEGISTSKLIECVGNELHLLKLQDKRELKPALTDCTAPALTFSPKL